MHDEVNYTETADISGRKSGRMPSFGTSRAKKIRYKQNRKPTRIKKLSASGQWRAKKAEHQKSSVQAKVEHVFAVIKGGSGIEKRDTEVCQTEYAVRAGELGYG